MAAIAAAAALSIPAASGLKVQAAQKIAASPAPVRLAVARASASHEDAAKAFRSALIAGSASLLMAGSAMALDIKMGSDNGGLVFEPASASVSAGEAINFKNNAGFPHNIVFDEDAVPAGVNADAISRSDLLNAKGDTFTVTLSTKGTYEYYCEPHQGAGMAGKITVN